MSPIDFGRRSQDYARHRHGPPAFFFERLEGFVAVEGARVLDLATGPGTVALELVKRGATVTGIDVAEEQVAAAREEARERGLDDRADFRVARAEATGVEPESFDLVTAGQCWHWLDGEKAAREALRVLRPGGTLVIVAYSYLSEHCPVARDSEALILEFNPEWTMAGWDGLFPAWIDLTVRSGFDFVEQFCTDYDEPYPHEDWRGRIRTCNGVGSGGMAPEMVGEFDAALARLLAEKHPEPMTVRHRLWCVVAGKPG